MDIEKISEWTNKKIFSSIMVLFVIVGMVCIYTRNFQEHHEKVLSTEQCSAQLESTKNHLEVVMEYKDRTDKLLADLQKYQETDKDNFKGVMERCFAVSQQSLACQNQLEVLQTKCMKTRADCSKIADELSQLKTVTKPAKMT